jgi:lipoate-protein ligase A
MKYLDLTLPTPAENLALDEAFLELAEREGDETLRVWESPWPFVVLGLSNHLSREANVDACRELKVEILRRCSGGGTVVQGPGCLSYALALRIDEAGPLATITSTNRFIMETHRQAIETLIGQPVAVRGHTDLETGGRKLSGNAQRRGRRALLFHGTFLYAADLPLLGRVLSHPSREPDWREGRSHDTFLRNVALTRTQLCSALQQTWQTSGSRDFTGLRSATELLAARHRDAGWIARLP